VPGGSLERLGRAPLTRPQKPREPRHIGGQDRGELSFDGWGFQFRHLPNPEYIPTSCEIRGVLSHSEARWQPMSGSNEVSVVSTRPACTGAAEDLRRTSGARALTRPWERSRIRECVRSRPG